jgi:hypothetical protein
MAQIDTSSVMLADTMIGPDDTISIAMVMEWDTMTKHHRLTVWDTVTMNDSTRIVSEGREANGKVPVKSFIDAMPLMIEEVIVLNKLMGPK